jgi:hypothetical protein
MTAQKLMIKWKEKISYSWYETSYISPYKEIFWQGSAVSTNVIHPSYMSLGGGLLSYIELLNVNKHNPFYFNDV